MYTMPHGVIGSVKPWLARLAQRTAAQRGAAERQDQNDGRRTP